MFLVVGRMRVVAAEKIRILHATLSPFTSQKEKEGGRICAALG
jgi:hypothetical protein